MSQKEIMKDVAILADQRPDAWMLREGVGWVLKCYPPLEVPWVVTFLTTAARVVFKRCGQSFQGTVAPTSEAIADCIKQLRRAADAYRADPDDLKQVAAMHAALGAMGLSPSSQRSYGGSPVHTAEGPWRVCGPGRLLWWFRFGPGTVEVTREDLGYKQVAFFRGDSTAVIYQAMQALEAAAAAHEAAGGEFMGASPACGT